MSRTSIVTVPTVPARPIASRRACPLRSCAVRRVSLLALVILIGLTAVVARPGAAHACECTAYDAARAYAEADAVFTGETIDVRVGPEGDPTAAEPRQVFQVDQVFKGEVFEQQSVVSASGDDRCGLAWEQPGAIAIVFGYRDGAGSDVATMVPGELAANRCTSTALTAASVVPEFGQPFAPVPGASPVGIDPPPVPEGGDVRFSWEWIAIAALAVVGVAVGVVPKRPRRAAPG
jgi:hypothetical protein